MRNWFKVMICTVLALSLTIVPVLAQQDDGAKLSLTTGLPTEREYKPLQMTFDNEPGARPQIGMARADVVYEFECYTGGYTRYLAIFNDDVPEVAEGCRSTRIPALEMYWNFGGGLAHYGGWNQGAADVNAYIAKLGVDAQFDGIKGDSHYHRDKSRKMPHNAVAETESMVEDTPTVQERRMLSFSADTPTVKGEDVSEFAVVYQKKSYYPSYKYNAGTNQYDYYFNGKQKKDGANGEAYSFSNVIIVKYEYWFDGGHTNAPMIDSTGTHAAEFFIGGKHFTGSCVRESIMDPVRFLDDEGNEVKFLPGKTFIQMPDEKREIQYLG